jgi:hypothetical protein
MLLSKKCTLIFSKFCIFLLHCVDLYASLICIFNYWFLLSDNTISIKFYETRFYLDFTKRLKLVYPKYLTLYFGEFGLEGLGYRISKLGDNLYQFFFTQVNFFYMHVPTNILVKMRKNALIFIGWIYERCVS